MLEKKLASLPIDAFEIYRISSRQLAVESRGGEIETCQEALSLGLAVQLFQGGKTGFASTSDESEAFLERVVQLAYNTLSVVEEGPAVPLPGKSAVFSSIPRDEGLARRPFEEKADLAKKLERAARDFDRRVSRVRGVRYEENEETVALKNSCGFNGDYTKTLCELSLMVMAEENGQQEMAWESDFASHFSQLDPSSTARRAAERAVALLGAKPIPTQKTAVLLDPSVGASFLSVLATSFLGDQVLKGKSILKNRLGEKIYSSAVSLVDDGRWGGGYASAPFDGEGSPTQKTELVKQGSLQSFLHDRLSAHRMEQPRTGNGIRPVYKEIPRVGVTNFFIQPGQASLEQLLKKMGRGFWITDLIGVHTANPVSGDFSLGAVGFWVEGGVRKSPVRGVAVSGNLHELFAKVAEVGGGIRFYNNFGSPPLLISEMDLGGT